MELSFRDITRDNWLECVRLSVLDEQKEFVASNAFSLAQAKYETEMVPKGIYCGEAMVGFAMYAKEPETGRAWIMRLMIDRAHQGKGYGKAALAMLVEAVRQAYSCAEAYLSVHKDNAVATRMYEDFGFNPTGGCSGSELVYRYNYVSK